MLPALLLKQGDPDPVDASYLLSRGSRDPAPGQEGRRRVDRVDQDTDTEKPSRGPRRKERRGPDEEETGPEKRKKSRKSPTFCNEPETEKADRSTLGFSVAGSPDKDAIGRTVAADEPSTPSPLTGSADQPTDPSSLTGSADPAPGPLTGAEDGPLTKVEGADNVGQASSASR